MKRTDILNLKGKRVMCISKEPLNPNYTKTPLTQIEYRDEGFVTGVCKHSHGYGYSVLVEITKGSHPPVQFISAIGGDIVKTKLQQFKTFFEVSKPTPIIIKKWKPPYYHVEVLFPSLDCSKNKQGHKTCRSFSLAEAHGECVVKHPELAFVTKEDEEEIISTLTTLVTSPYNYHIRLEAKTKKHLEKQGIDVSRIETLLDVKRVINL